MRQSQEMCCTKLVLPSASAAMDAFVVKGNGYLPVAWSSWPSRCCLGISYRLQEVDRSVSRVTRSQLSIEFHVADGIQVGC